MSEPATVQSDPAAIPGVESETPLQHPWRAWRAIFGRIYTMIGYHNVTLMAAGVAFYSFLAFVPLLGAVVMTYGLVADPGTVAAHMETIIGVVPVEAAKLIQEQLLSVVTTAAEQAGLGLGIALLISIYGAMRASSAIMMALNVIYEEEEGRNMIKTTLVSAAITLGAVLVAVTGLIAASVLGYLQEASGVIGAAAVSTIKIVTWIIAGALASTGFAFVYRYGPDRQEARWRWLTIGSIAATLLWLLATLGFGFYVAQFADYNATYGSLGAVVVLLMWLWVSALAILVGAEINAEVERQTGVDTTTGPERARGDRGATMADSLPSKRQRKPRRDQY